jgi:hypothetical protein
MAIFVFLFAYFLLTLLTGPHRSRRAANRRRGTSRHHH